MSKNAFIIIFAILTSIGWVATDIYLPSLPTMTSYFDTTITLTQLSLPAYMITFSITPLIVGPLSDAYGRRGILCISLALSAIATLLCILAGNIYWLILGRVIQGGGFGAVVATARAMLPDQYQGADMARISSINGTVAPIILSISPLLGGFIQQHYGWQMVFVVMFVYTALSLAVVVKKLDETNTNPRQLSFKQVLAIYAKLLKNRGLMAYGIIPAFVIGGAGSYITISPYLFQHLLGLTPSQYGMISVLTGAMIVFSGALNSNLLERFQLRTITYLGNLAILLAGALLLLIHATHNVTVWTLTPICMLFFTCINLVMPNIYSLAFEHIEDHYGTAMALLNTLLMIGLTTACSVASVLPEENVLSLAGLFLISGFSTLIMMWVTRRL